MFPATSVVAGVTITFDLVCEALDAAGTRIPKETENPVAASWGSCYATDYNPPE